MSKISVRLPESTLLRVRLRALQDGTTIQELGSAFFERYATDGLDAEAGGGVTPGSGAGLPSGGASASSPGLTAGASHEKGREPVSASGDSSDGRGAPAASPGLGAADETNQTEPTGPVRKASAAPRPDRKDRAHKGLCPHRVPIGSYCKRCEEGT